MGGLLYQDTKNQWIYRQYRLIELASDDDDDPSLVHRARREMENDRERGGSSRGGDSRGEGAWSKRARREN